MLARIRQGQFTFPAAQWGGVSEEAKSLIGAMLTTDPARRITVRHRPLTITSHRICAGSCRAAARLDAPGPRV